MVVVVAVGLGYMVTSTVSVIEQLPGGAVHTTLYFCFFAPGPFQTIFTVGAVVLAPAVIPLTPETGDQA